MSQRESGYMRKELDSYETPGWVTEALLPHLPQELDIWEPAAGSGKMVSVFARFGYDVTGTDITDGPSFLDIKESDGFNAIITNPPYVLAREFIDHALNLMMEPRGLVAMLLRTDFDHAKTRQELFTVAPFAKKLVLTKRIKWFEDSKGQPSFNHAWFIWNWQHHGPPVLAYGP